MVPQLHTISFISPENLCERDYSRENKHLLFNVVVTLFMLMNRHKVQV